jgi:gas vesicle protein
MVETVMGERKRTMSERQSNARVLDKTEVPGDTSDKLAYFLAGAGVGTVIVLLFAPKAGKDLRADITSATRRGRDYAKGSGRHLGERAGDYYQSGVDLASDLAARGKAAVSHLAEHGQAIIERQKEQISAALEAGKQGYREAKRGDLERRERKAAAAGGQAVPVRPSLNLKCGRRAGGDDRPRDGDGREVRRGGGYQLPRCPQRGLAHH